MKGSWQIARIAGIGVFVHWTFLLLLGWLFLMYLASSGLAGAIAGVGLILAMFVCIVLHEFGHALTARRFGVTTKDITLLPIGGVARMDRIPRNPRQELLIAIAGPAVNIVIAGLLFLLIVATGGLTDIASVTSVTGPWLDKMLWFNVVVVVFNMLPAFPMDGGRVLRAILASRMDYVAATQLAARVGQAMALMFGVIGLMSNWVLIFIALFVFLGARAEAEAVRVQDLSRGAVVGDAMVTRFMTLDVNDTLQAASDALLRGSQHDFPILDRGRLVGVLYRPDLIRGLAERDALTSIADVMQREFPVLQQDDPLEPSLTAFESPHVTTVPVMHHGRLAGLLTQENFSEWISVGSARRLAPRSHNSRPDDVVLDHLSQERQAIS